MSTVARVKTREVQSALGGALAHWTLEPHPEGLEDQLGALRCKLRFDSFASAFAFMTQLAIVADKRDHHPELWNVYDRVHVGLSTHDAQGVSQRDIDMARAIERIIHSDSTARFE